jgi:hypothetical protein
MVLFERFQRKSIQPRSGHDMLYGRLILYDHPGYARHASSLLGSSPGSRTIFRNFEGRFRQYLTPFSAFLVAALACGLMLVGMPVIDSTDGKARVIYEIITFLHL